MNPFFTLLLAIPFLAIPNSESPSHALYLATIHLDHTNHSETASTQIKVFSDDLQSAIRNAFNDFKAGPLEKLFEENKALIEEYFSIHIQLKVDGQIAKHSLSRWEQKNDVFLLSFDISCPKEWRNIHFQADFFMELFPTQTNVLSLTEGTKKRFARLTNQSSTCQATF